MGFIFVYCLDKFSSGCLFSKVVLKVQSSGLQLCLLVLSAVEYETAVREGIDLMALSRAHRGEGCARPRLCHISREPGVGLGLSITSSEGTANNFYNLYWCSIKNKSALAAVYSFSMLSVCR